MVPHLDARLNGAAARTDGTAEIVIRGDSNRVAEVVRAQKGQILASVGNAVTAVVPARALREIAGQEGVVAVEPPVRGYSQVASEGVHLSNADAWQTAGQNGDGVKVAIVDGGFANLAAEGAGASPNLPASVVHYVDDPGHTPPNPDNQNHCANENASQHGTAVAEIVHQMAPLAQLYLYCIDDTTGFQQAEQQLQAAGVTIVNSSLGFPADGRGDGTGTTLSAAATVRNARQNQILWVESAGNNGEDHWPGTFVDGDHNGNVDLVNSSSTGQDDFIGIFSGGGLITLQWDQWPTSNLAVTLHALPFDNNGDLLGPAVSITHAPGTPPIDCLELPASPGDGCGSLPLAANYDVWVSIPTAALGVHYDLTYWGDVNLNYLSCGSWSPDGTTCLGPSVRAQSGSVTEPASSPYALAVGAVDARPGANGGACSSDEAAGAHQLEAFSSQGPTIDGRVKPDIAAFDGVSSNLPAFAAGFCGTSAAAPHVAGAAALVKGANPNMDPAQIQDFLERRAGTSPPNNQIGHGVLTLGATSGVVSPAGSGFAPLAAPQRILDTRNGTGGHTGALNAGQFIDVSVPGVPADATAVAINLTGTNVTQPTFLASYPGQSTWPGTSNLNLAPSESAAAVFVVVTLGAGAGAGQIRVRNDLGKADAIVDLLGYYSPSAAGKYAPTAALRLLDTRDGTGGHTGRLSDHQSVAVSVPSNAGVPADATSLIVNVTATDQTGPGNLLVSPNCGGGSSTLNYTQGFTRANLTITKRDASGGFCVFNQGFPVQAIVDLVGYIGPNGMAKYVALPSPIRVFDTRTGNGGRLGPLGVQGTTTLNAAGIFDVPYSALAVQTGVVATGATAPTYLAVAGGAHPSVSTLNVTAGRNVANAAVANLTSGGALIYNDAGSVNVVVDLFGYYV
jgi:hypothetical protein